MSKEFRRSDVRPIQRKIKKSPTWFMITFILFESSQRALQVEHDQSDNRKNVQFWRINFFYHSNLHFYRWRPRNWSLYQSCKANKEHQNKFQANIFIAAYIKYYDIIPMVLI